jgi:hypothetical protein
MPLGDSMLIPYVDPAELLRAEQSNSLQAADQQMPTKNSMRKCIAASQVLQLNAFKAWLQQPHGYASSASNRRLASDRTIQVLTEDARYVIGLLHEAKLLEVPLYDFGLFADEQIIDWVLTYVNQKNMALFAGAGNKVLQMIQGTKRRASSDRKKQTKNNHLKKPSVEKWLTKTKLVELAHKLLDSMDKYYEYIERSGLPPSKTQALKFQRYLICSFFVMAVPQRMQIIKQLELGKTLQVSFANVDDVDDVGSSPVDIRQAHVEISILNGCCFLFHCFIFTF